MSAPSQAGRISTESIAQEQPFDLESVRRDFPILATEIHGKPLAYLDNAATSQKPRAVIDALSNY